MKWIKLLAWLFIATNFVECAKNEIGVVRASGDIAHSLLELLAGGRLNVDENQSHLTALRARLQDKPRPLGRKRVFDRIAMSVDDIASLTGSSNYRHRNSDELNFVEDTDEKNFVTEPYPARTRPRNWMTTTTTVPPSTTTQFTMFPTFPTLFPLFGGFTPFTFPVPTTTTVSQPIFNVPVQTTQVPSTTTTEEDFDLLRPSSKTKIVSGRLKIINKQEEDGSSSSTDQNASGSENSGTDQQEKSTSSGSESVTEKPGSASGAEENNQSGNGSGDDNKQSGSASGSGDNKNSGNESGDDNKQSGNESGDNKNSGNESGDDNKQPENGSGDNKQSGNESGDDNKQSGSASGSGDDNKQSGNESGDDNKQSGNESGDDTKQSGSASGSGDNTNSGNESGDDNKQSGNESGDDNKQSGNESGDNHSGSGKPNDDNHSGNESGDDNHSGSGKPNDDNHSGSGSGKSEKCTDGTWSEWKEKSACSAECGGCGRVQRERECLSFKDGKGCPCTGDYKRIEPCNIGVCRFPKPSCCPPFDLLYIDKSFACGPQEKHIIEDFKKSTSTKKHK